MPPPYAQLLNVFFFGIWGVLTPVLQISDRFSSDDTDFRAVGSGVLKVVSTISLEAITASELTWQQGTSPVDLGRWHGSNDLTELNPLNTEVARIIPSVWRLSVSDPTQALDVRITVMGRNGCHQCLSHVEHPSAEIKALVRPMPARVLKTNGNLAVLEGGLTMSLLLDEARFPGKYTGTVVLSINNL